MTYGDKSLIISAGNKYLFPAKIVAKENIDIINFHNALLPAYPGRNAPTWAIFNGESESGATWHWVTAGVDEGDCLWQGRCLISDDMKVYELVKKIMELAYIGFKEIFVRILQHDIVAYPQVMNGKRKMYFSYNIPNNGMFSVSDNPNEIYKLLRATDFGINKIFPNMICLLSDGRKVEVLSYRKIPKKKQHTDTYIEDNHMYIVLDDTYDLKIKYR